MQQGAMYFGILRKPAVPWAGWQNCRWAGPWRLASWVASACLAPEQLLQNSRLHAYSPHEELAETSWVCRVCLVLGGFEELWT